ncbi:Ras like protein [Cordyceps fumosorosea ARSEF 2679]|uniref:UDP-N-acetylglucosamine transferase subunit ALG14 n=1 Tax=Cordyceps fumosorosea (strain ARSEF 2679) TaxID=1081104 RepID=A0A168BAI7_CORFA|nr:Ras like protein [Cordyceps fumosorosea ARSEF 2679]OAA69850.1 Ras like protein [Cordyceps fumosorosea ARSEF 2679]
MSDHDSAIDINSWRHSVPSRLEREDPFANDGFGERPVTRLLVQTFREQDDESGRPASRLSVFRARLFPSKKLQRNNRVGYDIDDQSTIYQRPSTVLSMHTKTTTPKKKKKKLLGGGGGLLTGLFRRGGGRKRSREEFEDDDDNDDGEGETLVSSVGRPSAVVEPVPGKPLHLNFLFVGCPSSGQTSLLYRIRYGYFPDTSVMPRTRYETYTHQPRCNGAARVELWDTSGAPDLATVQLLAHIHWDVIFLCFDISDAASLQAIVAWRPLQWKFTAEALFSTIKALPPRLRLLGTKKDLRWRGAASSARRFSLGYYYQLPASASARGALAAAAACVSSAQGAWQARCIDAKYGECSALTGEGADRLVEEAAAEATRAIVEKDLAAASLVVVAGIVLSTFSLRVTLLLTISLTLLLAIFITVRHIQIVSAKRRVRWPLARQPSSPRRRRVDDYRLFVLGSGGHTREMLMMMDDGACDFAPSSHRRYLISSGDDVSAHHARDHEAGLPGTHDVVRVARARRVHQSLLTTPASALRSILDIVPALLSPPPKGARRYPSLVFSNGPATGFFVALVIRALKMAWVVPQDCMRFVYVESWARISTLSLTGRLLLHTGLADFFAVQHAQVAARYGVPDVGQVVFNARRDVT